MTTSNLTRLLANKRPWTPTCGVDESVRQGAEDALGRALALRVLELPVGDWVLQGESRDRDRLTAEMKMALLQNAADEQRHDTALDMAVRCYRVTTAQHDADAASLAAEWIAHGDHPIVKAAVIECSIFFALLPMFRFLGGPSLRTISRDISGDEAVHVVVNTQISAHLGYGWSRSLDQLRARTIEWVVDDLKGSGKWFQPETWRASSEQLLHEGRASLLTETKAAVMPAFFELPGSALPKYSYS